MDNTELKTVLLMRGNHGKAVGELKTALRRTLTGCSDAYPGLLHGNTLNADTEAALRTWQSSIGLVADGIAGPRCLSVLLGTKPETHGDQTTFAEARALFPFTRPSSLATYLPYVNAALQAFGLNDATMTAVALATIRAETEGFVPIAELPSHFNTLPGQPAFSAYDGKLGNHRPGDGMRFRGRGFVQLTGRDNYALFGKTLDIPLDENPDFACAPEVAACLLAAFIDAHREALLTALAANDLKAARRIVNGGDHGLERFSDTYRKALDLWPLVQARSAKSGRRAPIPRTGRRARLNVTADIPDLRDRAYLPPPRSLPPSFPADAEIERHIGAYTRAGLILDQGQEGACTGFGLACVINYLRWVSAGTPKSLESVSPRMLYKFARRYDEYEGENYDGSSCRGALKGWFLNGVCLESRWPYDTGDNALPRAGWDTDSMEHTLGVYYRVDRQSISDLQAAIMEVGAVYVSATTHDGWDSVPHGTGTPAGHDDLPTIVWNGKPSHSGGHAFALVGFNRNGFVLQNSWGPDWGAGGFAILSYADWLANAMDAWVTALGVPGIISGRLTASVASGANRPSHSGTGSRSDRWWDRDTAYRHSVVLGNNGRVSRHEKPDGITRTLQHQACVLPNAWFRENGETRKRLVIYAHGGLNSESDAVRRAQAMGAYFLGNGCYPLFLVWKSGLFESLGNILSEKIGLASPRGLAGGFSHWVSNTIGDMLVEKSIGRPFARPLWSEMKENAELASASGRGCDLLTDALRALDGIWGDAFEIHLIGHSAGSIMLGRLLDNLAQKDLTAHLGSVHLYAPACTVAFANRHYAPNLEVMRRLYIEILSDAREQADNVAQIYRKSLLYLVSNALEADCRMPILGLANVFSPSYSGWDGSAESAETLANWRNAVEISALDERLTIHDSERIITRRGNAINLSEMTVPSSHGGFDNNIEVVEKTLQRITGAALRTPVDDLHGY